MEAEAFLQVKYSEAVKTTANKSEAVSELPEEIKEALDIIISNSESSKGVLTVVFTSAVYKCLHPEQDIRRHQSSIENGYSGRTFDSHYITPFLKKTDFRQWWKAGG